MSSAVVQLDLTSVDAKLEWAIAHFDSVHAEIAAWLAKEQYKLVPHRNADYTMFWMVADMPGESPNYKRWALMLGDCFTNLRDTLDHMVYAIAALPTSPCPEKKDKATFLVAPSKEKFIEWGKTKTASVPIKVKEAMLCYQPFNRPNDTFLPMLSLLSELANTNKHKLLNVVMAIPGLSVLRFKATNSVNETAKHLDIPDEITHGQVVFGLMFDKPEPTMQLEYSDAGILLAIKHSARVGDTAWGSDRTPYDILFSLILREVVTILDALRNAAS